MSDTPLYEKLEQLRTHEGTVDFDRLTKEQLKTLWWDEEHTDNEIGALFGVPPSRVRYKRRKLGLTLPAMSLDSVLSDPKRNSLAKERFIFERPVDAISKAITHFAFRYGPVEGMHTNGGLSDSDMKTLNKFMVNRLAYVIGLVLDERWFELRILVDEYDRRCGHNWDPADPDDGDMRKIIAMKINQVRRVERDQAKNRLSS